MKKIFTFILLMVVGTMWGITSVLATNDAGLEEITMETGNDPGGDRGELSLVEAFFILFYFLLRLLFVLFVRRDMFKSLVHSANPQN